MGLYVDKKDGQGNLLSYIKSNFKCRHQNCQIGIGTFANERKITYHIYILDGILLSHIKEQNYVICRAVDEPRDCHRQ